MRHNKSLLDFYAGCAYSAKAPQLSVRHHKVQHRDQQQTIPFTLRLMTEHDLAMLYECKLILSSSGGAEKKHARHLLTYRNITVCCRLSGESVITHGIVMLNGRLGGASRTLLLEAGTDVEEETDPAEYAE